MEKVKYWAALLGSAWCATAITQAILYKLVVGPSLATHGAAISFLELLLISFLSALPATLTASVIEPIFRVSLTLPTWMVIAVNAIGGSLVAFLTPLLLHLIISQNLPNSYHFKSALIYIPAGVLGGILFFSLYTRGRMNV